MFGWHSFCLNSVFRSAMALSAFIAMMQSPFFVRFLSLVIIRVFLCVARMFSCP